jgi:exodeoxyribonuclease V beta subunit
LRAHTADQLRRFGLPEAPWTELVSQALGGVLDTPLDEASELMLNQLKRSARVSEMEFTLPVRRMLGKLAFDPDRLADTFEQHGADLSQGYVERLRQLGFAPLMGFLRGFIDLVFEHQGRYFVVDYKSNHLGSRASDYDSERLAAPMEEHHYHLQYHLYLTALHRHLARRLPGYDYDQHIGGVYYLFLRGISPRHQPGTGVFRARPTRSMIESLSSLLDGAGGNEA